MNNSNKLINKSKIIKEEQKRQYKKLNKEFKESYFVFINEYGDATYPDTISKRFKKILEKNTLKKITFMNYVIQVLLYLLNQTLILIQ